MSMAQPTKSDPDGSSQSLCQYCGLCCDGTLFGHVPLQPHDDIAALRDAGVTILAKDDTSVFLQPCVCYENKLCGIYARRPQPCINYKCKLLKRYENNKVTSAQAFEIVESAVSHRDRVRSELQSLTGASTTSVYRLFQTFQRARGSMDPTSWTKQHAQTLLQYVALQHRLTRFFGTEQMKVSDVVKQP